MKKTPDLNHSNMYEFHMKEIYFTNTKYLPYSLLLSSRECACVKVHSYKRD